MIRFVLVIQKRANPYTENWLLPSKVKKRTAVRLSSAETVNIVLKLLHKITINHELGVG